MRRILNPVPLAMLCAASLFCAAAPADTLASSAILNSFSASVGSVSTSFNASSDASSPGRPLRTGEYRVQQIVAAPGREGDARLTLVAQRAPGQGAQAHDEVHHLFVPRETLASAALAEGHVISVRERSYGLELAKVTREGDARVREPFFLVVSDERWLELQTRPVRLSS